MGGGGGGWERGIAFLPHEQDSVVLLESSRAFMRVLVHARDIVVTIVFSTVDLVIVNNVFHNTLIKLFDFPNYYTVAKNQSRVPSCILLCHDQ